MCDRQLANPSPPPSFFEEPAKSFTAEDIKKKIKKEKTKKEKNDYEGIDNEGQWEKPDYANEFFNMQATNRQEQIYHCDVCDSNMNSQEIYLTHLKGKRHQRRMAASNYSAPSVSKPPKRPDINVKHIKTTGMPMLVATRAANIRSLMQSDIDKHKSSSIIGLSFITEIRMAHDERDPVYYCQLCPAECQSTTLISHVIGFKHKMSYLRLADPEAYSAMEKSYLKKSESGVRLEKLAVNLEKKDGRGQIMVEMQVTPEDGDVEVLNEKKQPQLPPSIQKRFWDSAHCLTIRKQLQSATAIVHQLLSKQDPTIDSEAKLHSVIVEREKNVHESLIEIRLKDPELLKILFQKANKEDYQGMIDSLYKMTVSSSMGQIGRAIVILLLSKPGIISPVKKEPKE